MCRGKHAASEADDVSESLAFEHLVNGWTTEFTTHRDLAPRRGHEHDVAVFEPDVIRSVTAQEIVV